MFGKLGAFLGLAAATTSVRDGLHSAVDREQACTFRTPQEKKAHIKARTKAKNAKAARKRNRR